MDRDCIGIHIQQTMNAYTYFKGLSLSVEPDMPVETAGKDDSQKNNDSQKESDTDEIIVSKDGLQISEKENPIDTLNDVLSDTSDNEITVSHDENVIALIDTGVGESANVIDRISVIDDVLTSTGHGNDMLQAIVSQNPDAKVLSIRAMNDNGLGTISSLVAAMEYAINENVDMMNLSLYARTTLSTSVLKSEIQKAVDAGITVIGAAGNDGVDVADYVPGSVEEALIIGAANEKGARLETSNFGKTVDYNVVAESTSDATAKFTGFVSKNGLETVSEVLNQGMIYETEYTDEESVEVTPSGLSSVGVSLEDAALFKAGKIPTVQPNLTKVYGKDGLIDTTNETVMAAAGNTTVREYGSNTLENICGVNRDSILRWLSGSKVSTNYYLSTAYCPGFVHGSGMSSDYRNPNGDCGGAYGAADKPGVAGMNCTGFVWHALTKAGGHDIPGISGWVTLLANNDIKYRTYTGDNINDILNTMLYEDGFVEPGDIIWTWDANVDGMKNGLSYAISDYHHVGIYVGTYFDNANPYSGWYFKPKGDKNGFWHSSELGPAPGVSGNMISNIIPKTNCTAVTVVKTGGPLDEKINLDLDKKWEDEENAYQTRPSSVGFKLERRVKPKDGTWGNWQSDWKQTDENGNVVHSSAIRYTAEQYGWHIDWDGLLSKDKNGTEYQYRVREIIPENYRVEGTHGKVDVNYTINGVTNEITVPYTFPVEGGSVTYENILNNGYLKIIKESDNPAMTDNNNCYDLSGAEFEIYTDEACTKKAKYDDGKIVTKKVTNPDGTISYETRVVELVVGTYYVKETKAPKGFEIIDENQPYRVDITVGHRETQPFKLSVTNHGLNDPAGIEITKIWDGPETSTIPPLAGTQFTICYYDDYFTKDNLPDYDSYNSKAKRKWVIEIKWNEKTKKYMAGLTKEYLVAGSDDLYYFGGVPVLPLGTISIQETKAAPGYTLEGQFIDKHGNIFSPKDKYVSQIINDKSGVFLQGGNKYTGKNTPQPIRIRIRKIDENGKPLAGAEFTLMNSKGENVSTKTSGADGYVVWEDLYPDRYTITEIKTKNQKNLLKDPIVIDLPKRISDADITKYGIDKNKLSEKDPTEGKYFLFDVEYEISNHANFEAPMTGGFTDFMTFLPLVGGMAGLTGVGAVAMKRKRKKK